MKQLAYIKYIGNESDNLQCYEFFFSDDPIKSVKSLIEEPTSCGLSYIFKDFVPEDCDRYVVKMRLKLDLAIDSLCFTFNDIARKIVAIAWENIDDLEEYPDDRGRLFLRFGEDIDVVDAKLNKCKIITMFN